MPHLKNDKRQKVPKQYREKKLLKTAENHGKCDSELQFNVKKDVENDKKTRPQKIFKGYKKPTKKY